MIKRLGLASVSLLALAGAALAADLPPPAPAPFVPVAPVFTWTGFYIGTHSGGLFADNKIKTRGNAALNRDNVATGRRPASASAEDGAYFSGVQAGYNVQFGSFVIGVEADISYTDVESFEEVRGVGNTRSFFRQDIDFFGTVRGRVGVAFDNILLYGTGGLAGADFTNRVAFLRAGDNAFQFTGRRDETDSATRSAAASSSPCPRPCRASPSSARSSAPPPSRSRPSTCTSTSARRTCR